ncbi:DEK_C domain-containing protein [Nephila pilipes]|uniref:DEK_C domain-containing protein n=1 Tax=Nephila pilipes TaxID=299642 RepID=A0A8X6UDX9_NEPPI|nr:DEK_C domain-containing protein [Nephila pilipes]
MSSISPDSPEVEEGSPFGGVECEESSPEPVQLASADYEQPDEENLFPIVNVSVELYEGPDEAANANSEISSDTSKESVAKDQEDERIIYNPGVVSDIEQQVESIESTPDVTNLDQLVERIESTPDVANFQMNAEGNGNDVPNSSNHTVNEDSATSDAFNSDVVVKPEPYDPDYKLQKTYIEDFIYSNASSFDEGSNSNFDDSFREEPKGSPLSRFPKIVKAFEGIEYESVQVLYQLLYQRSAWDTQEILTHGILEFSGFSFGKNSEDYFNREMMLRTQPTEMLLKIGSILNLDQVQRMLIEPDKRRDELIASIMCFLSKPNKKTRTMKPHAIEEESTSVVKRPTNKCGCRNSCIQRFTKAEQQRLLQYVKELDGKKMLESYLVHFMECKKIIRNTEVSANCKKLKEVFYSYKCKFGSKEIIVCKGGFCLLHGVKLGRVSLLQGRLKTGINLPPAIDLNDFPPLTTETDQIDMETSGKKTKKSSTPRKKQQTSLDKKIWISSEEQIRKMEEELRQNINKYAILPKVVLEKLDVKSLPKNTFEFATKDMKSKLTEVKEIKKQETTTTTTVTTTTSSTTATSGTITTSVTTTSETTTTSEATTSTKKLKDFPLVLQAIENAPCELLMDIHYLLYLSSTEVGKERDKILEFESFTFNSESDDYEERNDFLQRMTFRIVGNVARSFSLAVLSTKEETIKNILTFLLKPDESFLRSSASMPVSLSDVEIDDFCDMSDSDTEITCEVVEKKVECITLVSSGEESDGEGKSHKSKKNPIAKTSAVNAATLITVNPPTVSVSTLSTSAPSTTTDTSASEATKTTGAKRTLRNFETICKIVNTHPHEYLVDIFELLYLKKHEPQTLRKDILDFSGFTFEMKSPEYIKRKQLLDRMLYNSVRRIYNTLIHNTTEVKVFSKPTMITEIFQFLFNLPDHDTSVRPPPTTKPSTKSVIPGFSTAKNYGIGTTPPSGLNLPNLTGKLSDLKRVFQRVACFPCEYLIDVHKLLFMTECDPKVIRQNIFAFKGFSFDVDSQEFQQRKMYLEYLTFHSLRKISSVLTTRSVDLRNSTKHELATHLTQVLAEYTKLKVEEDLVPPGIVGQPVVTSAPVVSSTTPVENIVVTPTIDPSFTNPVVITPSMPTISSVSSQATSNILVSEATPAPLSISIVDARSVSDPAKTNPKGKRKRKSTPTKQTNQPETPTQFAESNVDQYHEIYGQSITTYQPTVPPITPITGIAVVPVVNSYSQAIPIQGIQQPSQIIGIPQTIQPTIVTQVPSNKTEMIVPGGLIHESDENPSKKKKTNSTRNEKIISASEDFHNKLRDTNVTDGDEDCDKPLSSLVGHPIDSVLKKHIIDIVDQSDLESITINGVIQKIFNMYPKFDLSYRKEFIKSTLRSILYRLGEEKSTEKRDTNSPDCSVTTTDDRENISETSMECN